MVGGREIMTSSVNYGEGLMMSWGGGGGRSSCTGGGTQQQKQQQQRLDPNSSINRFQDGF